jgi:LPXTG-motif cell wall-anchored protein
VRKLMISAVAAVASLGLVGAFAPMAGAGTGTTTTTTATTTTTEVAGYPPVPTTDEDDQGEDENAQAGPVVITPGPNVDAAAIDADLPSTGSDSKRPLQVAGALLVAGVLAVFAVRRRRHTSPEPGI